MMCSNERDVSLLLHFRSHFHCVASFFHDLCECVILTLLINCQHSSLRTCPQRELCALRQRDGGIMEESQRGVGFSLDALIARRQSQLVWTVAMSL